MYTCMYIVIHGNLMFTTSIHLAVPQTGKPSNLPEIDSDQSAAIIHSDAN